MTSVDDIFQKQFEYIDELLLEKKFKEAYEECNNIIRTDPANSKAKKYQTTIENLIDEHNRDFAKKEKQKLESLHKEGKTKEAIAGAEKLVQLLPHDTDLLDYLAELQKEYREKFERDQGNKYKTYKKQIEELIKSGRLDEALDLSFQLGRENPSDRNIGEICYKARLKIVDGKIKNLKSLFATEKYEEILNTLYNLKKIQETTRLKDLLIDYTNRLRRQQVDEKHDFIAKAKEDITYLYQMKKYSECVKAAQELLRIDSQNSFAKNIISKAGKKLDKQVRNEVFSQMDSAKKQEGGIKI